MKLWGGRPFLGIAAGDWLQLTGATVVIGWAAMTSASPKRHLGSEQRQALELLAHDPRGATGHLLMIAHGFEMKMLAGLVHDGLVEAKVGESVKAGGKTIEVIRFWITAAGRNALSAED
jgi:hypothetical protein